MSLFFKSNNLSLGYGNQLVINNLDLSLKISNNYEIIGKNGSGKTTLLMCISNNFIGNTFNSNIERGEYSFMEIGSSPSLILKLSLIENIKYFLFKESIDEKFIFETLNKYKLNEFKEAIDKKDIKEVADALTDILYVTYGAGHAFGIDLDKCFNEVQNSNMSKLGDDGKPIYNEKGKVMKGPKYFKPDLTKFILWWKKTIIGYY